MIEKKTEKAEPTTQIKSYEILDNLPEDCRIIDYKWRCVYLNDAALARDTRPKEELIGSQCKEMWPGIEESELFEKIRRCMEKRIPGQIEIQSVLPDGSKVWFNIGIQPVPEGVLIQSIDITESKRAEEEIRSAKAFLDKVIDMSPFATWISDREGTVIRANRSLCDTVNLKEEQIIGKYNVLKDVNLEDQGVMPMVRAIFDRYETARFAIPWKSADAGNVDLKDARDMYIDVSMFPILNAQNELTNVVCHWVDMTEHKRAEEVLRESEERFRALVDGAPDGIFVQSEGRVLYVNPAMVKLLGAERADELLYSDFIDRVAPDYREAVKEGIRTRLESGLYAPPMEQEFLKLDGSPVAVETVAVPLRFKGYDAHLVFVRNISARRKAEAEKESLQAQLQQAQKIESIGRLAGGVAHDFNNMLGVILGHTEMAMDKVDRSHPIIADLEEIRKAASRSTELTRQLLAFARRQAITPKILDLNETVEGMLKMLQRLIGEDVDLAWIPCKDLWHVNMDPSQIDQILVNHCVNSRDAITSGMGKITIETSNSVFDEDYCAVHPGYAPGKYVMLAVSDNGSGMDKELLIQIFEPFFTTKETGKGTGLGLSTVYGIVKQNKGFINVYSEPGHGTTFRIYLPRHESSYADANMENREEPDARGHETILLVEDEQAILKMTAIMLEKQGYRVLPASLPDEAILLAKKYKGDIHLVMTDVVMPNMNGKELVESLLSLYPKLKSLYMSGYTADAIARHGVLNPGINFIMKPFTMKTLAATVRKALDGK
jgi:two-component system, cell cycle sensor histidine kinase and response regulator CckA